jgi:hypothetical protein
LHGTSHRARGEGVGYVGQAGAGERELSRVEPWERESGLYEIEWGLTAAAVRASDTSVRLAPVRGS